MRIAIIGAGPSGIAAGRELLRQGFEQFTIIDALDAPGGTWRLHSYPGLACDVWAHSYSFSYAPNPDWSASFVEQPEIQAYLARCAEEFGLSSHMRFNTRINSAEWQDESFFTRRFLASNVDYESVRGVKAAVSAGLPLKDLMRADADTRGRVEALARDGAGVAALVDALAS